VQSPYKNGGVSGKVSPFGSSGHLNGEIDRLVRCMKASSK